MLFCSILKIVAKKKKIKKKKKKHVLGYRKMSPVPQDYNATYIVHGVNQTPQCYEEIPKGNIITIILRMT